MAVLAVFLLLALAGVRACEEDQWAPSTPEPTSAPAATAAAPTQQQLPPPHTSTPAAAAAAPTQQPLSLPPTSTPVAAAAAPTQQPLAPLPPPPPPPHPPSPVTDRPTPAVVRRRKYMGGRRRTARSLYKYAIMNAARQVGRSVVRKLREYCEEEDSDGFYVCPDDIRAEAQQFEEFSIIDDWCEQNPDDPDDLESGLDDDPPLDITHRVRQSVPEVSVRGSEQEAYDSLRCTEADRPRLTEAGPSTSVAAGCSIVELFANRDVQVIPLPSLSRPVSHAPWNALQLQGNRETVIKTTVEVKQTALLSRPQYATSDIQPEINIREQSVITRNVEVQDHRHHSAQSQRESQAPHQLASTLTSAVTFQMVEVRSQHEPVPIDNLDDIPDETMEVDGDDTSDGSFVEVGSVESDAAQAGSHSDNSEETDTASNTPEEYMNVEMDDWDLEVASGVPDVAAEVEVGTLMEYEEAAGIIQRLEGDLSMEPDNSLQPPAGPPEPQPGPSGLRRWPSPPSPPPDEYWRPPSPPLPNISILDYPGTRYSRHRESVIYSARGYPGSEGIGHLKPLEWVPPPPKDVRKELDRIFGVQEQKEESSTQKPEDNRCMGELRYTTLGTNVRPMYVIHVQCQLDPNCPPPTKCAPLVSQMKVSKRKNVPFAQQTFKLLNDPSDEWGPALLNLPTACFCAPPGYDPQPLRLIDLPESA